MFPILSEISFSIAAFALVVAAMDVFLDRIEKAKLANSLLSAWYFFSNYSWERTIKLYRTEEFFRFSMQFSSPITLMILGVSLLVMTIADGYSEGNLSDFLPTALIVFAFHLIMAIMTYFVNRTALRSKALSSVARSVYFWAVSGEYRILLLAKGFCCGFVASLVVFFFYAADALLSEYPLSSLVLSYFAMLLLLPLTSGFSLASVLVVRVLASTLLAVPIWALERLLRLIYEFEKGPTLGFAAVLASIGVFLKLLG